VQAKTFFFINALVVAFIIWRIFSAKQVDQPSPLEIGHAPDRRPAPSPGPGAASVPNGATADDGPTQTEFDRNAFEARGHGAQSRPVNFGDAEERSLNCWFQFNGHTWDAFEVLGVPAGSTRDACYRALIDMRRNRSHETDFLDEAWAALERHFRV
jgi:hypothetical protein